MRHVSGTRRADLDWPYDRMYLDPTMSIQYFNTAKVHEFCDSVLCIRKNGKVDSRAAQPSEHEDLLGSAISRNCLA